jgi:hypothetical protein
MSADREQLVALATAHALAEGTGDVATVFATLVAEPRYELQPVGLEFRGMAATRKYYDYFFSTFQRCVVGAALRGESVSDEGVVQEYTIWTRTGPGDSVERHDVVGILTFGTERLSGERVYGSERLLRVMFGPVYEDCSPIEVGEP